MTRKPNRMYREIEGQIYTRTEYMGGIPHCRITQFDTGNPHQRYKYQFTLRAEEACNVQDRALEAARVSIVRVMDKAASNNFHIKVRRYPHAILREHKMATGAGADRISDGMRGAFGKPVGHAVRAQINEPLITLSCRSENIPEAKEALRKAACKLPTPTRVEVIEHAGLVEETRYAAIAPLIEEKKKEEAAPVEGAAAEGAAAEGEKKEEGAGGKKEKEEAGGKKGEAAGKKAEPAKAEAGGKAAAPAKKGK
ncbi:MAG: 50S ribosomal protein L16 [Euryarchaeota archaeon]|nr:50S ribosomal protein L16 [Euryarchaeota archaeon]MDE2046401.1 50S ribosomal protein L16 [Thermoplasmata archaeon]